MTPEDAEIAAFKFLFLFFLHWIYINFLAIRL
jgi:hypothetical protein